MDAFPTSLTLKYVKLKFDKFDTDKNGTLEFTEFHKAVESTLGFQTSKDEIKNFFDDVDKDQNGTISFLGLSFLSH